MAWPLPAHLPPRRPQPTNLSSSCNKTSPKRHHTFSAQSSRAQRKAGNGPESRAAQAPPAGAARVPLPRSPPGGQEAQSAPYSPRPRAVRRLAQGAGFLEEISRKSAGPLASGSLPNPAGARSSPAPLTALGEGWEGAAGSSVPPFLLLGEGGVAQHGSRRRPLAQQPLISIYPPPPTTGHVLHILGRLGAGGGVSSRDWWGTDGEPHPVYPLVL